MRKTTRIVVGMPLVAAALAGGSSLQISDVNASEFPSKPIRLVVGFPAGGGGDLVARVVGQKLAETMGQPVIIDNRAGAGGVIGSDLVAKGVPDGHIVRPAARSASSSTLAAPY